MREWLNYELDRLRELRVDNPNLSQRAFARLVHNSKAIPMRSMWAIYHKVVEYDNRLSANLRAVATLT